MYVFAFFLSNIFFSNTMKNNEPIEPVNVANRQKIMCDVNGADRFCLVIFHRAIIEGV